MSLVRNERLKLAATALNTLSTATITVGVIAPSAAILYGLGVTQRSTGTLVASAVIWISLGVALHFAANRLLGRLQP